MEEEFFDPPNFEKLGVFLRQAPKFPSLLLLRHGQRPEFPPGTDSKPTFQIGLTDIGRIEAEMFGKRLLKLFAGESVKILGAHSSRSPRCAETAELICTGFGTPSILVENSDHLSGIGLWTSDNRQMIIDDPTLMGKAVNGEVEDLIENVEFSGNIFLRSLLELLPAKKVDEKIQGFVLCCSHDFFLGILISQYLTERGKFQEEDFPKMMECLLIQRTEGNAIRVIYRDTVKILEGLDIEKNPS